MSQSKRTMTPLDREEAKRAKDAGINLFFYTRFICEEQNDPGVLTVLIDRSERMLMAMFTYSHTTTMNPSDSAVNMALKRLEKNSEFQALGDRDKFFNIKYHACGIDKWNRKMAGGTILQAILSCAAGLTTIKYSDDAQIDSLEISKKLDWTLEKTGTRWVSNTVTAAVGYVGGIHENVMKDFAFDTEAFERDFLVLLHKEIPALHLGLTLNKIVVYDVTEADTLATVSPTTSDVTTEVELPDFPLPF